ncbi:hypothetical protein C0J52_09822 [Blattella germanica]|nr:hypothetical protein C0J52_09822 [Blattella germanica]
MMTPAYPYSSWRAKGAVPEICFWSIARRKLPKSPPTAICKSFCVLFCMLDLSCISIDNSVVWIMTRAQILMT